MINFEDVIKGSSIEGMDITEITFPLEKNFNRHDEFKGKRSKLVDEVIEINIGSSCSPKWIKIGKNASKEQRRRIEELIREYKDVFAWTYDDLKTYNQSVIEHTIPLKEGAKLY